MNRGFTLVEVLVSIFILGIISLGAWSLMIQMSDLQSKSNVKDSAHVVRGLFLNLAKNEDAIRHTIEKTPSMSCLRTIPSTCTSGSGSSVIFYGSDGELFYNSSLPQAGFSKEGQLCSTFGLSGSCPLRYTITWKTLCQGACEVPQIVIKGELEIKGMKLPINSKTYGFQVIVPRFSDALWIRCAEKSRFFLPSGFKGFVADADGCIDPQAFQGAEGPPGPQGPQGEPAVCPVCS